MKNKPHSWICHAEFSLNYFSTYAEFHKNLSWKCQTQNDQNLASVYDVIFRRILIFLKT